MNRLPMPAWRALVTAGASALVVASIGLVSSSAAEPATNPPGSAAHAREDGAGPWAPHLQAHIDHLAERLEIKASQEGAWQKFSAAFMETMGGHPMEHAMEPERRGKDVASAPDAAGIARRHADMAQQHAQRLARLADATAALEAVLTPDQRQVFDGAARHFASEHGHMGSGWHAGHGYGHEEHAAEACSPHAMGENGMHHGMRGSMDEPHGSAMGSAPGDDAAVPADAH